MQRVAVEGGLGHPVKIVKEFKGGVRRRTSDLYKRVGKAIHQRIRSAGRDQITPMHQRKVVAVHRFIKVVGRHKNRGAIACQLVQTVPERPALHRRHIGGRLIEKQ